MTPVPSRTPAATRPSSSPRSAVRMPRWRSRVSCPCTCPARSTVRSGSRPPPTWFRRSRKRAWPTGLQPRSCSRRRSAAVPSWTGRCCAFQTVLGWASSSTRTRSPACASRFCPVDPTNRNTALASALADELARAGIAHACVSPGSRSAPLALALWRQAGIQTWTHVDERSSGFFALGLAQQTGLPVAILTTSGTAGANLHPAVAEASESRTPLVVITADRPPELRGRGAGQTIDQLKLFGSSARWFCEVGVQQADDAGLYHVRAAAVRAVAESQGTPPGPVHVNFPFQEPLAPDPVEGDVVAGEHL